MLPAFFTTILFALSGVCAQRTSKALGGVEANFWRVLLATFLLAVWAHTVGGGWNGHAFPIFLLSGFLGFGLGDVALYQALPRLGSRLSILLVHCLAAPFAAATEWAWLGHGMTPLQMVAAGLILSGVALALAPGRHLEISRREFWTGIAWGVLAAVGQGMGAVLSRRAYAAATLAGERIDGLTAAYQRILAGLVVAGLVWLVVRLRGRFRQDDTGHADGSIWPRLRSVWPWILANTLAGPTIGVGCYQWALSMAGTGVVLPIVALTPLVIIPFSRYVEGEIPRKRSLFGGGVAVAGVFILAGGAESLRKLLTGS